MCVHVKGKYKLNVWFETIFQSLVTFSVKCTSAFLLIVQFDKVNSIKMVSESVGSYFQFYHDNKSNNKYGPIICQHFPILLVHKLANSAYPVDHIAIASYICMIMFLNATLNI